MSKLTSRRGRRGAVGPKLKERARRHWREAFVGALCGTVVLLGLTSTASANAPEPTAKPLTTGSVLLNPNGTITVNAQGTWLWPFGVESEHTRGLDATVKNHCDNRTGGGWGIVWNDPADPGFSETYTTKLPSDNTKMTVHVGSKGVNPANADDHVQFDQHDPCGTFVQTNMPAQGDGYDHGTWTATHVYASQADLPSEICVVTYDLGLAHPPGPHRISFENNDNSIQWDLTNRGGWNTSGNGPNCATLPPPVLAPPPPPTTVVPVVKTVHPKSTPHTTKPAPKVVTTSHPLAFTGFGNIGRLVALLGGILLLVGMFLYFFDIRRGALWLLGSGRTSSLLTAHDPDSRRGSGWARGATWSRDTMESARDAQAARAAQARARAAARATQMRGGPAPGRPAGADGRGGRAPAPRPAPRPGPRPAPRPAPRSAPPRRPGGPDGSSQWGRR